MTLQQKNFIKLVAEVKKALDNLSYGSVELYVQNNTVTQITVRQIRKTSIEMNNHEDHEEHEQETQTVNLVIS